VVLLADHPRPTSRQGSGGGPPPQLLRGPGQRLGPAAAPQPACVGGETAPGSSLAGSTSRPRGACAALPAGTVSSSGPTSRRIPGWLATSQPCINVTAKVPVRAAVGVSFPL